MLEGLNKLSIVSLEMITKLSSEEATEEYGPKFLGKICYRCVSGS